jgi:hypothetical protein
LGFYWHFESVRWTIASLSLLPHRGSEFKSGFLCLFSLDYPLHNTDPLQADNKMQLYISISLLILLPIANSLCYTPDGELGNDVPCNPENLPSVCCTAGFVCMSNGLCQPANWYEAGSSQFIRGTCSDQTWTAPQCHGYCVAGEFSLFFFFFYPETLGKGVLH